MRVKPGQRFIVDFARRGRRPAGAAGDGRSTSVYEDAHLLVSTSRPGSSSIPAPGNPDHTLVNALLAHCGDSLAGIGGVRGPASSTGSTRTRSGLMVVAKNERGAYRALGATSPRGA